MRIVSGILGGRVIKTVSGRKYRPATDKVRQAVFSMLEARGAFWPEMKVLDLYAGSGSMGLEALSRGAKEVWFVEKMKKAASVLANNLREFDIYHDRFKVLNRDVLSLLRTGLKREFQLVFIDPPYGQDLLVPTLENLLSAKSLRQEAFIVAEVESAINLEKEFSNLDLIVNKTYGQTRIFIWVVIKTE